MHPADDWDMPCILDEQRVPALLDLMEPVRCGLIYGPVQSRPDASVLAMASSSRLKQYWSEGLTCEKIPRQ